MSTRKKRCQRVPTRKVYAALPPPYIAILAFQTTNSIQKHKYNDLFIANIQINRHKETYLSEEITEGPANKGSEGLGSEGLLVEGLVVGGPAGDGTAAGGRGVAEESALLGGARRTLEGVGEGGLGQRALRNALLDRRGGLGDAEGRGGDEEGGNEDGGELHLSRFILVVCGIGLECSKSKRAETRQQTADRRTRRRNILTPPS